MIIRKLVATITNRMQHLIDEDFYTYRGIGCDHCHLVEGDHEDWCHVGKVEALLDRLGREAQE